VIEKDRHRRNPGLMPGRQIFDNFDDSGATKRSRREEFRRLKHRVKFLRS
jgi:hypothetical protein